MGVFCDGFFLSIVEFNYWYDFWLNVYIVSFLVGLGVGIGMIGVVVERCNYE